MHHDHMYIRIHIQHPTGVVDIDVEVYQQLQATGLFEYMDLDVDEAEHSLEMQVPFLQHIMQYVWYCVCVVCVRVVLCVWCVYGVCVCACGGVCVVCVVYQWSAKDILCSVACMPCMPIYVLHAKYTPIAYQLHTKYTQNTHQIHTMHCTNHTPCTSQPHTQPNPHAQTAPHPHTHRGHPFTLVPVMVGVLDADSEANYGAVFAKYLEDPCNLFVISSDFCHWGPRFDYFFYNASEVWCVYV